MFWTRATVFKQTTRLRTAVVVAGLAALLLVWLASTTRPWLGVENKVFDWFTSASAARRVDVPIVILAIDEPTFSQLQIQWPFPRRVHAQAARLAAATLLVLVVFTAAGLRIDYS